MGEIKQARRKVRVFPKFATNVGPQRYAHRDPRPDLPFEDEADRVLIAREWDRRVAIVVSFAFGILLGVGILEKLGWIL